MCDGAVRHGTKKILNAEFWGCFREEPLAYRLYNHRLHRSARACGWMFLSGGCSSETGSAVKTRLLRN